MSEHTVFLEGSRDVSVMLDGSWGEGIVHLRPEHEDAPEREAEGDVSLEGSWVHVQGADNRALTFPAWQVLSIEWTSGRSM
jgi:hypothetical protein